MLPQVCTSNRLAPQRDTRLCLSDSVHVQCEQTHNCHNKTNKSLRTRSPSRPNDIQQWGALLWDAKMRFHPKNEAWLRSEESSSINALRGTRTCRLPSTRPREHRDFFDLVYLLIRTAPQGHGLALTSPTRTARVSHIRGRTDSKRRSFERLWWETDQ